MSEYNFRQQVVKELTKAGLDAFSVENPSRPGTPDVNYIPGWIELKWLPKWPKQADTIVKIDHFTPQQRNFLRRRWNRGGPAHLLLRVGSRGSIENLLFEGPDASDFVGLVDREKLEALAVWHTFGKIKGAELAEALAR